MNKEIMITISKDYFDMIERELDEFKNGKDGYVLVSNTSWNILSDPPDIYTRDNVLKRIDESLVDAKNRIKELTVGLYEQIRAMDSVELDTARGRYGLKKIILRYFPRNK